MQLEITQLLAGRPALATCLDQVMEVICRRAGWDVAVLWQLSAEQGKLRCHRILHPTCELDWAFEARLGDLAVPRGMGMAGAVWSDHRPRWRADLRIEPDIDTAAALDGQFRSACCFAISVNDQALGVCQFLSRQPKPVDREMLSLVEGIGAQLGLFVDQETFAAQVVERERRFRSFVEATSQIYWCANAQGEIIETHQVWEQFTGQTSDQASGYGWMQALCSDDVPRVSAAIERALATGEQLLVECRVRRHDGIYRLFQLRGIPVRGDDGSIQQWVGTAADIEDAWRSQQALRHREAELSALFNAALDGMMILDDAGRVIDANPAACQILARSPVELQTLHVHDMTAPGTRAKAFWRSFRQRRSLSGQFAICRPDGRRRLLEFQAIADFQPGRHLSIFRDVTERDGSAGDLSAAVTLASTGDWAAPVADAAAL